MVVRVVAKGLVVAGGVVDSRCNVLIAAEYEGGNPPWYNNSFRDLQKVVARYNAPPANQPAAGPTTQVPR